MTTFHCGDDGLHIYVDGKLVATIEPQFFAALIYQIAHAMRGNIKPIS